MPRGEQTIEAKYKLKLPAQIVLQETDPDRLANLLGPDAAEWQARKNAGLPHAPLLEDFRSDWARILPVSYTHLTLPARDLG